MQRFERDSPNELWQMDFKGPVPTARGPAHSLTHLPQFEGRIWLFIGEFRFSG
jgi:hypothetical protein